MPVDLRPESTFGTTWRSEASVDITASSGVTQALPMPVTFGRYVLVDELGRGGMGVVYRARDPELGREVALKVLLAGLYAGERGRRRFIREARAIARLHHPNIIQVYATGEHAGTAYFTMELIEGPSLASLTGRLSPRDTCVLVAQLARAVAYAHDEGLVHRDVKPSNVLLQPSPGSAGGVTPILTDFGLVKLVSDKDGTVDLTNGGALLGTPPYMAPEQLLGEHDRVGPAADQYALGVVLWELLCGERPYPGDTPAALIKAYLSEETASPRHPAVPPKLRQLCAKVLAREAEDRYANCRALAEDLDRFVRGEPVRAAGLDVVWRIRIAFRRYRRVLISVCVLALVAAGAVWSGGALRQWRSDRLEALRQSEAEARRVAMQERVDALWGRGSADEDAPAIDAIFQSFVEYEGNANTQALAQAWVDRGSNLSARGDGELALRAFATAYTNADDSAVQTDALLGIATQFRAEDRWSDLRTVLQTLETRVDTPAARRLRRDLLVVEHKILAAADVDPDPKDADFLRQLGQVTRTHHRARTLSYFDINGDGVQELALMPGDSNLVHFVDPKSPGLPLVATWQLPRQDMVAVGFIAFPTRANEPPLALVLVLVGSSDSSLLVVRARSLGAPEPTPVFELVEEFPNGHIGPNASGDVDGDGIPELYVSTEKGIQVFRRDHTGSWTGSPAHPETALAQTYPTGMWTGDLDGDGSTELVVSTGAWRGFDLRVYDYDGDALAIRTRRMLGKMQGFAPVRAGPITLYASVQHHDPNTLLSTRMFGPSLPHGEPRGIHLFSFEDETFHPHAVISLPNTNQDVLQRRVHSGTSATWDTRLLAGDLDGDGLDEIILGQDWAWTIIYRQRPDGTFAEFPLADLSPVALIEADGDPGLELLVTTRRPGSEVFVMGAGTDVLPNVEFAPSLPYRALPPEAEQADDPTLAERWERAERLYRMGLTQEATEQFKHLETISSGSPLEGYALLRAAEVLETAGDMATAATLYERVAKHPRHAALAWEGALRSHRADRQLARALAAAQERLRLPDPPDTLVAQAAELTALTDVEPLSLDLTRGLDKRWRIGVPINVRHSRRDAGLRLTSAGEQEIASFDLRRTTGPVRVTLDVEVVDLQWGSQIVFALEAPATPELAIRIGNGGGGEVYRSNLSCPSPRLAAEPPIEEIRDRPLRFEWELEDDAGHTNCQVFRGSKRSARPGGSQALEPFATRSHFPRDADTVPDGPVRLVIRGLNSERTSAELIVRRLELSGLAPRGDGATSQTSLERANHFLAIGQPEDALTQLSQTPRSERGARWLLARAVIADDLLEKTEAIRWLTRAVAADPDLGGLSGPLFRNQLDHFGAPLREVLGDAYFPALWRHLENAIVYHPNTPSVDKLLTQHLGGVEDLELDAFEDPVDSLAQLALLAHRSAAWRRKGRRVYARRSLERAALLADRLLASVGDGELRNDIAAVKAYASVERSVQLLEDDDREAALAALHVAVSCSPTPQALADNLSVRREFEPLRGLPSWSVVENARRLTPTVR